jgi:hypothetical protein
MRFVPPGVAGQFQQRAQVASLQVFSGPMTHHLPSFGPYRNMSPDAVSASHVAPMIVVAATNRIRIPIANVILTTPPFANGSTDFGASLCQT